MIDYGTRMEREREMIEKGIVREATYQGHDIVS